MAWKLWSRPVAVAIGIVAMTVRIVVTPTALLGAAPSSVPSGATECPASAEARNLPTAAEIDNLTRSPHVASFVERTGDTPESVALLVVLQEGIGRLRADLAGGHPESFGGLWVDHVGISLTVSIAVLSGEGGDVVREAACRTFEQPGLLRFVPAEVSYRDLEADLRRVSAWREESGLRESAPFDIFVDERAGTVVLETADDVAVLADARQEVGHPDALVVRRVEQIAAPASCTRTDCQPNLVGGLALSSCSTGFAARAGSAYGVLTAAHCGNYQSHDGLSVGSVVREQEAGPVDAQFHAASSYWVELPQVLDYQLVQVHGVQRITDDFKGAVTCKAGKVTGVTCGPLKDLDFSPSYVSNSFGFRRGDFAYSQGDSGGAVYTVSRGTGTGNGTAWAAGLLSGGAGSSGDTVYGHIGFVQNALGVQVLTPSSK